MEVELKTDKKHFENVSKGKKNFEVRLGDKNINEGDVVVLKEKVDGKLTGRELRKEVKNVIKTKDLDYFDKKEIDKFGYVIAGF